MATYDLSDVYSEDEPRYDKTRPESILEFAIGLAGKSLGDFLRPEQREAVQENRSNKGDLGNMVEKYFFRITPGNSPEPDFPVARVELKTTAVIPKSLRLRGGSGVVPVDSTKYKAKERLKLSSINYPKLDDERWETNSLFRKCEKILLLVSLYDPKLSVLDRKFVAVPFIWQVPLKDAEIIRRDWEIIVSKINAGKAHEISSADTYYLEATTSGSGTLKDQPHSSIKAKERSFAFKASYVTAAMLSDAKFVDELEPVLGADDSANDLESLILNRAERFYGQPVTSLLSSIGQGIGESKQKLALLSNRLLGFRNRRAEELVKAGIEIKSVHLRPNGSPREDVSFPAFAYMEIMDEDWEDSIFKQKIDSKLLFMVYQTGKDGTCRFKKAMFWNMPTQDIEEAHRVWKETKRRVNEYRADDLPRTDFSRVAFVRNHSANAKKPEHWIPSPYNGNLPVKGFWLHRHYIKEQLERNDDQH